MLNIGAFTEIAEASSIMTNKLIVELSDIWNEDKLIGMEIPPSTGMYAVKLWALDTHIYRGISKCFNSLIYLFNVSYLKFINKKYKSKNDTKEMINTALDIFTNYGYTVKQTLLDKRGKPRKITNNQCDSLLYSIRMIVKYYTENNIESDLINEIILFNDKFLIEKETIIGKKLDE